MIINKYLRTIAYDKINWLALIGWSIVFATAIYYINHNALRYLNINNSAVYTPKFKPFTPFIVTHVLTGMTALLIGPFQFFAAIRLKHVHIHRMIGKAYLICVFISAIASLYLAIFDNLIVKKEFMFGTGVMGMGLSWLVTSSMALWAIKAKNFSQHQDWMIKSYILTCNFVIFRLIFYGLLGLDNFPFKSDVGGFTAWISWSLPLLIADCILQAKKITVKQ